MYRNTNKNKITSLLLLCIGLCNAQTNPKPDKIDVNLNVGITSFSNPFKDDEHNSDMAYFTKAPTLGFEVYDIKNEIGFEVRRTYWLSLSSSSFYNDINAWASYTYLGLTKYFKLNQKHVLGVNVSYCPLAENQGGESYYVPRKFYRWFQLRNYHTAKAISIAPSINLTKKLFLETRFNYYYFTRADSIPQGINSNRIQFSLIYKINPLKK